MAPDELRASLKQQPFEPFRVMLSDGSSYEVRHPDLLWVGQRAAYVGLTGDPGQTYFERSVKLDLLHITQIIPLSASAPPKNGASA